MPDRARGTQRDGLVTLWDWYATWASLAGVDANDPAAEAAAVEHGLPPVGADSVDQWAYLTGDVATPPRRSIALGGTTGTFFATKGNCQTLYKHSIFESIKERSLCLTDTSG